jgi:hypothetical protein
MKILALSTRLEAISPGFSNKEVINTKYETRNPKHFLMTKIEIFQTATLL